MTLGLRRRSDKQEVNFIILSQENNPDKKETKATDLQGYWEMMNIQVIVF